MKLKKELPESSSAAAPVQGGAYISRRHRNPSEELAASKAPVDVVGLIFAIMATICVGVLIYLLYSQVDVINLHDQIAQISN